MVFKYKKRSAKDHKKQTVKQAGAWATLAKPEIPEFKPKEGSHTVRFCPPTWDDARHYGYDLWVNAKVGAGFGETFLSLKMMKQEPDPVAEAIAAAKAAGEGKSVRRMEPYRKVGVYVIEKGEESKGPQFWAMPQSFNTEVAALSYDDEETNEVLWIDNPDEGHWVSFKVIKEKTPEGESPKYKEVKIHTRQGPMSKDSEEQEEWLDFIQENPIPDILNFYDYDHIKAALDGAAQKQDEDEDEEAPSRRRSTRNAVSDDDEEETPRRRRRTPTIDDEDESLDEEEEEPPKRKRRKKVEEEEDEEEEPPKRKRRRKVEEEDEEEEPPKRKRRRKVEEEEEEEEDRAPKKRRRRKKVEEEDDEEKDLRKSGGLKKKRRRRVEEDED